MVRTADEFKQAAIKKGITEWVIRDCSICGYDLKYIFSRDKEQVAFDTGCDCTSYPNVIIPSSYEDIAQHYNCQTNKEYIKEMDDFWGFNEDLSEFKALELAWNLSSQLIDKGAYRVSINPMFVRYKGHDYYSGFFHVDYEANKKMMYQFENAKQLLEIINELLDEKMNQYEMQAATSFLLGIAHGGIVNVLNTTPDYEKATDMLRELEYRLRADIEKLYYTNPSQPSPE